MERFLSIRVIFYAAAVNGRTTFDVVHFDIFIIYFRGVRCEKCKPGFYGDKCKPCECPYANPENNFADTCNINVSTSLLECQCKPGYKGVRCDQCADGYYGNPLEIGGSCKRCFCNRNIDLSLTGKIFLARKFFSDKCISTQKKR